MMKIYDVAKFGLFCALLAVVIFEFLMWFNPPIEPTSTLLLDDYFKQVIAYQQTLGLLGFVDKILVVLLFGVIAFPKASE
jgi:hypothetical protein